MAITQSALAHAMARDLVRAAPPEAGIKRVWVWSQHGYIDPDRDYVEFAVLHDLLEDEADQRFSRAIASLHDLYPEVNMLVHTFSSRELGDLEPEGELRTGAEEVDLVSE